MSGRSVEPFGGVTAPMSRWSRTLSLTLPPSSSQTGAWKCFPLMSQSAMSTALIAPVRAEPLKGPIR